MSWQGSARFDYDLFSILLHAPMKSGIYAMFTRGKWVYIGESGNMCGWLLRHRGGDNVCMARGRPTHFAYELVAAEARRVRKQELIEEFQPECNEGEANPCSVGRSVAMSW